MIEQKPQIDKPFVIGICGPSSSGKTTIAQRIQELITPTNSLVFTIDSYYHDLSALPEDFVDDPNFDCPQSIDHELLFRQFLRLIEGNSVHQPVYIFKTFRRATYTVEVIPKPFIIIEGIFSLYWEELRNLYDISIFIDAPDDVCFQRRIIRDIRIRNYSEDFVRKLYTEKVRPMYQKYISPTRDYADFILNGQENPQENAHFILEKMNAIR